MSQRHARASAAAEAFVQTLQSKRLRDWYRAQLGLQAPAAAAAKAAILEELAVVLDRAGLRALQGFLTRCMQQQQQQQQQDGGGAGQVVECGDADPLLCVLVAPSSLDALSARELQARAGVDRLLAPK